MSNAKGCKRLREKDHTLKNLLCTLRPRPEVTFKDIKTIVHRIKKVT